ILERSFYNFSRRIVFTKPILISFYKSYIDFKFIEVNTIIGKLIEQGLIAGVGVGLERPPSSHLESIGTQAYHHLQLFLAEMDHP
ncbi:hypothetical protein Tco_1171313, partial [Tanacetum coccineum]